MREAIRLLLVGTTLGLAVSTFASTVTNNTNTEFLNTKNVASFCCLFHFLLHHVIYILGSVAIQAEHFRKQFIKAKTEQGISMFCTVILIMISLAAAASIGKPEIYIRIFVVYYCLSLLYLLMQRFLLILPQFTTSRYGVRHVLNKWILLTSLQILISSGGAIASLVNIEYAQIIWFPIGLVVVMAIDLIMLRNTYFQNEAYKEYDRIFNGDNESIEFYDLISNIYDQNQRDEVRDMHRRVITQLVNNMHKDSTYRVLDLGGGTGALADRMMSYNNVSWVNVDISEGMLKKFKEKFSVPTNGRFKTIEGSIEQVNLYKADAPFDAIISSFVLTGTSKRLPMEEFSSIMNKGGLLFIIDTDPIRTRMTPFFTANLNSESVALKCRELDVVSLMSDALEKGFHLESVNRTFRNSDGLPYSVAFRFRL